MVNGKYMDTVKPLIGFVMQGIQDSRDGIIRVKIKDFAVAIKMTEEQLVDRYQDLKYTLFQEGIVVKIGKTKAGEKILVMRKKMKGDTLERIDISKKFKDITISNKDEFGDFVEEIPEGLECSELTKAFGFGSFVEKISFDSVSCDPSIAERKLYIKLVATAKISDVIEIFKRIQPQEVDYDESTRTIEFWFD